MRRATPVVLAVAAIAALLLLLRPPSIRLAGPAPAPGSTGTTAPPAPVPAPLAPPSRAAGVVVVDADGVPAPGAAVDLIRPAVGEEDAPPVPFGITDPEGRIDWPAGALPLPALVRALHPERGGGEAIAASTSQDCTVRLLRPLSLRGTVVAADGSPIAGAAVEARFEPSLRALGSTVGTSGVWVVNGVSADDGSFRLRGLPPPDSALVTARKEGWMDGQAAWHASRGTELRVVLHRPFRARFLVEDESGRPVDGATVAVSGATRLRWKEGCVDPAVLRVPRTGPGEYTREDLAPGWYRVLVAKPGYETRLLPASAVHPERGPVGVVLHAAEGVEGRVVDAVTGVPVPGASVTAIPFVPSASPGSEWVHASFAAGAGQALSATTGSDGEFRIVVAGLDSPFVLSASAEGFHPRGGLVPEFLRGDRLVVPLTRRETVTLVGRAVDEEGTPVEGALVVWTEGRAETAADGRFRAEGFRAGLVSLFASGREGAARIVVDDGDLGDVVLHRLRRVPGVVVEGDGTPVAGLRIAVSLPGAGGVSVEGLVGAPGVSDDAGSVVVLVPEGAEAVVHPLGDGRTGRSLVPSSGERPFRLVVTADPLARAGSILGRLLLPDGGPPEGGGWVLAIPADEGAGGPSPAFEADPGGHFSATRLRPGRWTLRASTIDGYRGELPVVIVPADEAVRVELRLERAPSPPETPTPRVEVEVLPVPRPEEGDLRRTRAWATSWRSSRSAEARVSRDGRLRVELHEEEGFAIWVYDHEGKRAGVTAAEAPSAGRPVEVHLGPAGWIVLTPDPAALDRWIVVRDARETPIFSGFEASLPAVTGDGYHVVVPPGAWSVTISRGISRRGPRVLRVTVAPGAPARAE